jgi:hypothetical protein
LESIRSEYPESERRTEMRKLYTVELLFRRSASYKLDGRRNVGRLTGWLLRHNALIKTHIEADDDNHDDKWCDA